MKKRMIIGPQMAKVVDYVTNNPGGRIVAAATYVAPRGKDGRLGIAYGYATVKRCLRNELIVAFVDPSHRNYRLLYPRNMDIPSGVQSEPTS